MCGIVGFISEASNALHNVKHGLKTLEYRGYDSAGAAWLSKGNFGIAKAKGEVSNLFDIIDGKTAELAIGHTRWATHGEPNEINAHPHTIDDITIVHNGIIENYKELSKGLNLISQTDTEVIAQLIAKESGNLIERVRRVLSRLVGSYALAVMSIREPDKIVLACKSSPMVIGVCKKGAAMASDIYALIGHANEAIVMKDGETAILTSGCIDIFDSNNEPVQATTINIMGDAFGTLHHPNHDTYMHKEIFEQPEIVERCIVENADVVYKIAQQHRAKRILLTACGTSYHACLVAQILFENLGLDCDVKLASELRYSSYKLSSEALMVAVSQSGETADTLAAIKLARIHNVAIVSIINRASSTMSRESDATICTLAGPEISVASTKSFIAQMTTLFMLGYALANRPLMGFNEKIVPELIRRVLTKDTESEIRRIAETVCHNSSMLFLGRGYGVPVAQEGALKLKEISYIHAEAYPAGELKHGPIALIYKGMPCVFIADRSNVYDKVLSNLEEAKARDAITIAIVNESDSLVEEIADFVIRIPDSHQVMMPFTASVVLQLFAYHMADLKGRNIDKPRNLAKSVTVE